MSEPGTVIFRRDSKSSVSTVETVSDDMWDDTVLIDLYDKALNVAHEEVAKRFAMSTNSKDGSKSKGKNVKMKQKNKGNHKSKRWKIGSECRAKYSEDGLEYEATILHIIGDSCIIQYIGYNNEEEIKLSDLKPSKGENERIKQAIEANEFNSSSDIEDQVNNEISECEQSDNAYARHNESQKGVKSKKFKNSSKKCSKNYMNEAVGFSLPQLSFFNDKFSANMPLPPPPPPFLPPMNTNSPTHDDQTLSSMLISWYMSGYYTGLYQGQRMAKK